MVELLVPNQVTRVRFPSPAPFRALLKDQSRYRGEDFADRTTFVTSLAGSHGERLRRYLTSRLRHARRDVPDLVQEVFLRLWRIPRPDAIQNPEAYLFTVANHVLQQYALRASLTPATSNLLETMPASSRESDPVLEAERQQQLETLAGAMAGLSHKAQAALVLYRRDGLTLDEIAQRLGVSRPMVKKYVAKAVLHCRLNLPSDE
jgi:RNA polymerase sigma factor (sigma-70 family)